MPINFSSITRSRLFLHVYSVMYLKGVVEMSNVDVFAYGVPSHMQCLCVVIYSAWCKVLYDTWYYCQYIVFVLHRLV